MTRSQDVCAISKIILKLCKAVNSCVMKPGIVFFISRYKKGLLILPLISLDSPQQQWPKVKQFDSGRRGYTLLSRDRATRKSSTIKQPLRTMRIFQVTVFGNILLLPFLHYWVVWRCFAPKTACCLLRQ